MSYLQVVGEQHHQVESHMAAFTTRVAELRSKHNLLLPGALEVCQLLPLSFISIRARTRNGCSFMFLLIMYMPLSAQRRCVYA